MQTPYTPQQLFIACTLRLSIPKRITVPPSSEAIHSTGGRAFSINSAPTVLTSINYVTRSGPPKRGDKLALSDTSYRRRSEGTSAIAHLLTPTLELTVTFDSVEIEASFKYAITLHFLHFPIIPTD